jgi:hypothetical protein
MKLQQTVKSIAQVKINFMKSEDKIAELGSKAYYRYYRDGSVGIVGELSDGFMLSMNTTDAGTIDMTDHLKGLTVNLRLTAEQFEVINSRFHDMSALGAYLEIELDGNVEHGTLTVRNEEVESFTIYVAEVIDIQPMAALRVGTVTSNNDLMQRIAKQKQAQAAKSAQVIATNAAARTGVPAVNAEMFM